MASGNRVGGNLAQVTWTTDGSTAVTGEGGATTPPALNVAEFTRWSMPIAFDVEDTTPLASDSPRVDVNMRIPGAIEIEGMLTTSGSATSPDGAPRLPYTHTDGVKSTAKLRLIIDKNNPTRDYYQCDAYYVGAFLRTDGRRKQRVVHRFVPTGAITQVSLTVSTTIR